jgi:serine/threonine-protein kinase
MLLKNGRYKMSRKAIGKGNTSKLYKGTDTLTNQAVAIKKMKNISHAASEAEIMNSCGTHPGLLHYYDYFTENDSAYIVMEYFPGKRLGNNKQGTPRDEVSAAQLILTLLPIIQHLHKNGILHGDIMPHNVLISEDQPHVLKLIDFGVAVKKNKGDVYSGKRRWGTKEYSPPESKKSEITIDESSDVYSAGSLFLYLVAGKAPARKEKFYKYIKNKKLRKIIKKATHQYPFSRYRTAGEFSDALKTWLGY